MCSLPGLPTAGSEVHVLITRVNPNPDYDFVELWVNLDDQRKPMYERMTKDIQIYKKNFNGFEGKPGDLCLACVCDIWHRARIVSIEKETYNVFLIDQGEVHKTTNEALAWCQCDSFLLPPEIESCILANVLFLEKNLPQKTTGFLNSLRGKKLKGLVQHVLESAKIILLHIPIISASLCKAGVAKKVPGDEFNYLAEKNLRPPEAHSEANNEEPEQNPDVDCKLDEYLHPELLTHTFEIVCITSVTNPENIFCKLHILSKAVKLFTEQLQEHYKDYVDLEKVQPLARGRPCAARGTDGRWHRSLLKQNMVDDGSVEVLHVDEGQTELVPVENIKPLHWKFLRMPVVTYPCLLKGVEDKGTGWTPGQIDRLKSLLLHQTFVARFEHHDASNDIYSVSLYEPSKSTCINSCFMESIGQDSNEPMPSFINSARVKQSMDDQVGRTKFNINAHASQEKSLPSIKNQEINSRADLPKPGRDDISINSGSEHANHLAQRNGDLSTKTTLEQEFVNSSSSTIIGLECNGKGVVSEAVELNTKALGLMKAETIDQILLNVQDEQVLKVSKDAKRPNNAPLLPEVNGSNAVCGGDELRISSQCIRDVSAPKIQHDSNVDAGGKPTSETFLHSDSEKVQSSLPSCAKGNMKIFKWPNVSLNKVEEVYATCIVGPHYFWCQYTNTEEISSLTQEGETEQDKMFLKTLGPGSPCLALFACDNQWYRAQVIHIIDDTFHVLFIDYGNECDVNSKNLRPLPQRLLEMPPRAFLCSLSGFNESEGSWIDSVYDDFYTLLVDKPLKVTVLNEKDPTEDRIPQYAVQVQCENKIVNDAVLKYWKPVVTEHVTRKSETENSVQMTNKLETENPVQMTNELETENSVQFPTKSNKPNTVSGGKGNAFMYKSPKLSQNKKEDAYASSIVEPGYFWCQYANTEELKKVSKLCEEAGKAQQDKMFLKTIGPGSPCLALFASDNQWYRAQVIHIIDDTFHVLFIDYGNECDVDSKNLRPLPQTLLEKPPQAFLCSLSGFKESEGSWIDSVYDDFYTLLVDKLLKVTVLNEKDPTEDRIPQYAVQVECGNMIVNDAVLKYWKPVDTEHVTTRKSETENSIQMTNKLETENSVQMTNKLETENSVQVPTKSNIPNAVSKINTNGCMYKNPKLSQNKKEDVYASSIVEPGYFWCQYANTEELKEVSKLCEEAGKAQQDKMFLKTIGPGSPCLALFASDNQWYRAQVMHIIDDTFHVLFIDYGNECDVDRKNLRPLPQRLLEKPPQAFLCSLNGFKESEGSWIDSVYDDFYTLLVDKLLKVTVIKEKDPTEDRIPQYAVQVECGNMIVNDAVLKYWKPVDTEHVTTRQSETENSIQMTNKLETENSVQMTNKLETKNSVQMTNKLETENSVQMTNKLETENSVPFQTKSNMPNAVSKINTNGCMYKNPKLSQNKKEDVYASSIVEPGYFWCQYANTEELKKVSKLCEEAGKAQQDKMFLKTIGPGSPCLALFASDNQWYRAQVMHIVDDTFHVLFIDYGNECDVDSKNLRPLPQSLLEKAPQAFLCSLNGYNETEGSWVDEVYDDFYTLLVDRPLKLAVINRINHSERAVPQYMVEIECEGVDVNAAVLKYWEPVAKKPTLKESSRKETSNHDDQHNSDVAEVVSKVTMNTRVYQEPTLLSKNQTESVYATHIVEPNFFWCQYANTEELTKLSKLCQEAGEAPQDKMLVETLGPGSPCLAMCASDNQWYRAEVIHRVENTFNVLFIDYGNECDVDIDNVRQVPQSLLEKAPQAFLCSLNGFDESKGTWANDVFEAFHQLLTDKCLKVKVIDRITHVELAVPQYAVEIQCNKVRVNTLMEDYWKEYHRV